MRTYTLPSSGQREVSKAETVDPDTQLQRSYLFTIRVWTEPLGDGRVEYRGQVRFVLTGERCSFREWFTLAAFLEAKLQELDSGAAASNESG